MKNVLLAAALVLCCSLRVMAADACTVITKSDAIKYLGYGASGGMQGEECVYTRGNSILALGVLSGRHGLEIFNAFKNNKDAKAVPGLGVEAYFDDGTFVAKKGALVLELDYGSSSADAKKMNPNVIPLAKLALSRM